jgi:hypothetical protein
VTLASTANPTAAPLAQAIAIMMHPCQAQLRVILAWQNNLEAQPTGSDASGTGRTAPTWRAEGDVVSRAGAWQGCQCAVQRMRGRRG